MEISISWPPVGAKSATPKTQGLGQPKTLELDIAIAMVWFSYIIFRRSISFLVCPICFHFYQDRNRSVCLCSSNWPFTHWFPENPSCVETPYHTTLDHTIADPGVLDLFGFGLLDKVEVVNDAMVGAGAPPPRGWCISYLLRCHGDQAEAEGWAQGREISSWSQGRL